MRKICRVRLSKFAEKQLRRLPRYIRLAFDAWVKSVELDGLNATRLISGYHDEPLKGERRGQRSVHLSKSYRVIYEENETGDVLLVGVLEVNKHEY